MPVTAVIGAQFGDEAKGKVTDFLAEDADWVVRFQGGPNAGHSISAAGSNIVLHQVPSGILRKGCRAVAGPGMVISPEGMVDEISKLKEAGLFRGEFFISERAHVILPIHRAMDEWEEKQRGGKPTGTTLRGIGPAYMDRVGRWGIRMADLARPELLRTTLDMAYRTKSYIKDKKDGPGSSMETILEALESAGKALNPYVTSTEPLLWKAVESGDRILLEGAQGTLLDVDYGTYPFTTSSHTTLAGAFTGTGIPPHSIARVLGVTKAYSTRVGNGPFPTELVDETGERIREKGHERGATTGRPRRCGWLDLVLLRYGARLNGFTGFAMTKVDVLGGEETVKVATGYRGPEGTVIKDYPPVEAEDFAKLEPIYETFPGWIEFTPTLKERLKREGFAALPSELRRFLAFVTRETGVPVEIVSFGPAREETLLMRSQPPLRDWASSIAR